MQKAEEAKKAEEAGKAAEAAAAKKVRCFCCVFLVSLPSCSQLEEKKAEFAKQKATQAKAAASAEEVKSKASDAISDSDKAKLKALQVCVVWGAAELVVG